MKVRLRLGVMAVACAIGSAPVLSPSAAGRRQGGIIAQLSVADYREALACGRAGAGCAVDPYRLCPSATSAFSATLATPFSRVASGIFNSVRERRHPRAMDRGAASAWGIGIYVIPATDHAAARIERVHLRRGNSRIAPLTATVAPVGTLGGDGSSHQLARGFFRFPPEAFSPDTPLTVVFVTSEGEVSCTLDRSRLAALR